MKNIIFGKLQTAEGNNGWEMKHRIHIRTTIVYKRGSCILSLISVMQPFEV